MLSEKPDEFRSFKHVSSVNLGPLNNSFFLKKLSYKTKFYHLFYVQNKQNESIDMRGNGTINLLGLVFQIRL